MYKVKNIHSTARHGKSFRYYCLDYNKENQRQKQIEASERERNKLQMKVSITI